MTIEFDETAVNREPDGKFGEKLGSAPDIALSAGAAADGTMTLPNGWRSVRNTERGRQLSQLDGADKMLLNPDHTAEFVIGRDGDRVNVTMTDLSTGDEAYAWVANADDELAEADYVRGNLVFDDEADYDAFAKYSEHDPEFIDQEARQVREYSPEYRKEREFEAHSILPGDIIDMEPVLRSLKAHGHEISDTDLMAAEYDCFTVENVVRESPDVVVIYSDGGNYAVPADSKILVDSHEPDFYEGNPFAYPGEPDALV